MTEFITLEQIDETASFIRAQLKQTPKISLILGSGLGDLSNQIEQPIILSSRDLPHWPVSTVAGHKGQLVFGGLEGSR